MIIEEEFFKTFEIEPKYQDTCTVEEKYWSNEEFANEYGTFDMYMNAKCGNQENCTTKCSCAYQKEIYPQITDRILLELICLHSTWCEPRLCATNIEAIKRQVLRDLIFEDCEKLKQQVQKLFGVQ